MNSRALKKKLSVWTHRRHILHTVVLLAYFIVPLPLPTPLLHFDCTQWKVDFFGTVLVPGQFHILGLFIIFLCFSLTMSAAFLGKVFCGWVCPQNIFYELFEMVHSRLKKRFPSYRKKKGYQKGVDLTLSFLFSILIAHTFLLYFTGANSLFLYACYGFIVLFFTYDIGFLKHSFCKNACPYSFLQHSCSDKNSLHIAYDARENNPCNSCQACYKACYVGLDITKQPHSIDCTLCGACVDACSWVYSKKKEPPLLSFSFGKKKWKGCLTILYIGYIILFVFLLINKPTYSLHVFTPTGNVSSQSPEFVQGKHRNTYWLNTKNLSSQTHHYRFSLSPSYAFSTIESFELAPFESSHHKFIIELPDSEELPYISSIKLSIFQNERLIESKEVPFQRTL